MGYKPIESYGIIGNMYTTALVGLDGSIDWFCFPHHDSPSVFAALLDSEKGGYFQIAPLGDRVTCKQLYWPQTNVLITRFLTPEGVAEVVDFMPVNLQAGETGYHWLVRKVTVVRCCLDLRVECYPAFNYARDRHEVTLTENGACFHSDNLSLGLATDIPLQQQGNGVSGKFTLQAGESAIFVLRKLTTDCDCGVPLDREATFGLFEDTVKYWRRWLSQCVYKGRWRSEVERSALVLKLLTFEPTGAIVAAPTCSLPESIGGERNWDYRYTWIRDAAFTLYALLRIGFSEEAARFMEWISERCRSRCPDGSLQIMYGIDGRKDLTEETLDHLAGYKNSQPVHLGNGAYNQFQLDIVGELMDSVYLYNKYGTLISYELWTQLRELLDWLSDNWERKDEGIWEMRNGQKHHVYSKLMCWVAFDRALRLAEKRSFPAPRERWLKERDRLYEEIMTQGWNEEKQAFVQRYDCDTLDASNLLMPLVFFVSPTDPRMLATLKAINRQPEKGGLVYDSLVYRYNLEKSSDGLSGEEGTFNVCTFWLVEALTRAGKEDKSKLESARLMFEKMLGYANHLGLFSEEMNAGGSALGNFPQALTHLALISAAWNLNKALGEDE
ncbi:MAG: glycoside hydrolase family 15 protein [Oscillatoria sp. PMC 1068.18]|nr:glycoside hydrolase family 15 protein [Oscillatoria sp. PMC 1076.18]MEC4989800.1 glycoside hydrolase family 15 protein [Oscillatoria sp. PMC 1068.18]